MQAFQGTTSRVLTSSQSNHSTSNIAELKQPGNRDPQIELGQKPEPQSPPFGQGSASTDPQEGVPYQAFLALVSFVASIVFSLGISAAQSFSTTQSFFGNSLPTGGEMSDAIYKASRIFAWGGALSAIGLMASLAL